MTTFVFLMSLLSLSLNAASIFLCFSPPFTPMAFCILHVILIQLNEWPKLVVFAFGSLICDDNLFFDPCAWSPSCAAAAGSIDHMNCVVPRTTFISVLFTTMLTELDHTATFIKSTFLYVLMHLCHLCLHCNSTCDAHHWCIPLVTLCSFCSFQY